MEYPVQPIVEQQSGMGKLWKFYALMKINLNRFETTIFHQPLVEQSLYRDLCILTIQIRKHVPCKLLHKM
jgi:hypothetical protein